MNMKYNEQVNKNKKKHKSKKNNQSPKVNRNVTSMNEVMINQDQEEEKV